MESKELPILKRSPSEESQVRKAQATALPLLEHAQSKESEAQRAYAFDLLALKRSCSPDNEHQEPKKRRTDSYSPNRLRAFKAAAADRAACSKLRKKLRGKPEYQSLHSEDKRDAFLEKKVAELMDKRDEEGKSAAAVENEIIAQNIKDESDAKLRLKNTLEEMVKSKAEDSSESENRISQYAQVWKKHLEPVIQKHTRIAFREGRMKLNLAKSLDVELEFENWVKQNVDNPEDTLACLESNSDSDKESFQGSLNESSDELQVVVSSDEEDENEDSSDDSGLDVFVASEDIPENEEESSFEGFGSEEEDCADKEFSI